MSRLSKTTGATTAVVVAAALLAAVPVFSNAVALVSQDVTEKMSHDQRFGYLAGLVDMNAYQAALSGNKERAKCIVDAFYANASKDDDPWRRLLDALRQYPDKRPESIVVLLIQKTCGG
jgi:hypothetical protein